MTGRGCQLSRRSVLFSAMAAGVARGRLTGATDAEWRRYPDPATDLEVLRLTDPAHPSYLPAAYNRAIARAAAFLLLASDRGAGLQPFALALQDGALRQLTETAELDPRSLCLTPDGKAFCFFAGRSLNLNVLATRRNRELYSVPEGWERCEGMSLDPDGAHAVFAECRGENSRLRVVPLGRGGARTVFEAPFRISDPVARSRPRPRIFYRRGAEALWTVPTGGGQASQLKTALGRLGTAQWAPGGRSVLYLHVPPDPKQLTAIRESSADTGEDKLVALTSQFADFASNSDGSMFVGASRNAASPTILLLVRNTRRELTLCEHKASRPETVAPRFSPDSQWVYFQSDRHGAPAIYGVQVETLVERTEGGI